MTQGEFIRVEAQVLGRVFEGNKDRILSFISQHAGDLRLFAASRGYQVDAMDLELKTRELAQ